MIIDWQPAAYLQPNTYIDGGDGYVIGYSGVVSDPVVVPLWVARGEASGAWSSPGGASGTWVGRSGVDTIWKKTSDT